MSIADTYRAMAAATCCDSCHSSHDVQPCDIDPAVPGLAIAFLCRHCRGGAADCPECAS